MKRISVLIPTFKRNALLGFNLRSLARQGDYSMAEVIILDDAHESDEGCVDLAKEFSAKYVHSGATKDGEKWRTPGFAINIGARLSGTDRLLLCCAEMYHLNATIMEMFNLMDQARVAIPRAIKDDKGEVVAALDAGRPVPSELVGRLMALDARLPFFMGVHKKDFFDIGGYDEDFTGVCFDDNDITERLIAHGCEYRVSEASLVHLFHQRLRYQTDEVKARWQFNKELYEARKGTVVRNKDRVWGQL